MITDYSPAELWNIVLKIYKVLGLLVSCDIIEMNILVTPFKVVDDTFICQFILDYEYILEEVYDSLLNVKVVKLSNHCLLVLQVSLVLVNQCISLIYHISYIIKDCGVLAHVKLLELLSQEGILFFFFL